LETLLAEARESLKLKSAWIDVSNALQSESAAAAAEIELSLMLLVRCGVVSKSIGSSRISMSDKSPMHSSKLIGLHCGGERRQVEVL
jgi:hypothetical protein